MSVVIPPNTPQIDPAPVRTPVDVAKGRIVFKDNQPWEKFFNLLYTVLFALMIRPVLLSGLAADIPDPTLYPENSRYFETDTSTENVNLYGTPGDPSTAAWTPM